jgi:ATP synthase proteolipid subunit
MGVMNPQLVMRNIIPVVMAGVLGIYGLIVAVIIQGSSECTSSVYYIPHRAVVSISSLA